jgi:hypothetical protein
MLQAWSNKEALHYIVADQAGSGKTLAYLLPLIQVGRWRWWRVVQGAHGGSLSGGSCRWGQVGK